MKKILFFCVLSVVCALGAMAQDEQFVSTTPSNKNVVLEEYTGVNCGYCPQGHAIANTMVSNNPGRVFVINVHAGSFAASTYTTTHGNTLNSTFGVTSYPSGTVNRHTFSGGMILGRTSWSSSGNTILNQASPVNIAARGTLDWETRELNVTVQLYYTADEANATNKLNVAILQDNVIGSQSGASGNPSQIVGSQYRHMHMFRGYLPETGQWGDDITTTTAGSFVERHYTYTIPASLGTPTAIAAKLEDLHFIAFVAQGQQEILTGCEVEIEHINVPALNPRIDGIACEDVRDCSGDSKATVTVKNVGGEPLTAITFQYSVAGGAPMTYDWTGSIAAMQTGEIELPTLSLETNANQTVRVNIMAANGQPFEGPEVSCTTKKIVAAGSSPMRLSIKADGSPEEISFKMYAPNNAVVMQQAANTLTSGINNFDFIPTVVGCYRLCVKDSYGDGINYQSSGYIRLYAADNTLLFNIPGNSFTTEVNAMISVEGVNIDEMSNEDNLLIFPNPTTDVITITSAQNIQQVELYNMQGQRVMGEVGSVNSLNLSGLSTGLYLLKVTTEQGTSTYKVSKR